MGMCPGRKKKTNRKKESMWKRNFRSINNKRTDLRDAPNLFPGATRPVK